MGFPRFRQRKGSSDPDVEKVLGHPVENLVRARKEFLPIQCVVRQGGPSQEEAPPCVQDLRVERRDGAAGLAAATQAATAQSPEKIARPPSERGPGAELHCPGA